ncbi:hypothetical protein [Gordonia sp. (in: high G+C Gram-positive bacteria)]|uniref:hypothetical protein n=1 Tax=Gordonia sp. (in: high G+C Gram-positive bacteria) TaxID=84139 RepID=UPI003C717374
MGMNGQNSGLNAEVLRRQRAVSEAEISLSALSAANPAAGESLSRLVQVVAAEAARSPRFAKALAQTMGGSDAPAPARTPTKRAARSKRAKGLLDPFAVFSVSGETGLRARLGTLTVDQLKDIIAENGMNHDGAAMRWKTPSRLVDRIVERVQARSTKGDVLR